MNSVNTDNKKHTPHEGTTQTYHNTFKVFSRCCAIAQVKLLLWKYTKDMNCKQLIIRKLF